MITARELVFYIRAEDQASRVVKRAAHSLGSLSNIRELESKASQQQVKNLRNIERAQQSVLRNEVALQRAQVQASRLGRITSKGGAVKGFTTAETALMFEAATKNVRVLQTQEQLLAKDLDEVRRAGDAASASLDRQISQAKIRRLQNYITGVQGLARAFRLLGIVAAASLAFAAHAAAQISTQVTLAATQSTIAGQNTTKQVLKNSDFIRKQILQLVGSGKVTSTIPEQTDATYQIFSSVSLRGNQNQQLKEGIALLKQFNTVATANYGMVNLNEVTKAGIILMNRFHVSVEQMPNALNRMQAAVRFGAMNMAQFVAGFNQVAPAFNAAGYSFNQMAGTMAFVSRKFPNVAMGFTGLARLTETLANPKMLTGFKAQGIAVTDLTGHLLPLNTIIGNIIAKNPKLVKGGVNLQNYFKNTGGLQSTVQARRVFVSIAQDLPGYDKMLKQVIGDNNELDKSWRAMQQSPQVSWTEFTLKLKALVIQIGIYAIPAIIALGKPVARLVEWFDGLSEHTKKLIATIGVFGSVATVVGGSLIILAGALAKAILNLRELKLLALASEAGATTPMIAGLILVLVTLSALLIKYPHLIRDITNAFGGLKGILIALSIFAAAFTMAKVIFGLTLTGRAARQTGLEVMGLRSKLLGLAAIPAILIPIGLKVAADLGHGTKPGTPVANYSKNFIWGNIQKLGGSIEYGVDRALGDSPSKARAATITDIGSKVYLGPQSALDQLAKIDSNPMVSNDLKVAAHEAFANGNYGAVKKIAAMVAKFKPTQSDAFDRRQLSPSQKAFRQARQISARAEWLKEFDNIIRLDKALSDGKVHTVREYRELLDAEDKLQKASTGNQYSAAMQMLSALESTWNKAEKSATKHAKNLAKIAKQNVVNAKNEIQSLLQGVQSMYDSFLQQNQSTFGELFAGPIVTGARVQDNLQFGGHVTDQDLLKDQLAQNFQYNKIINQYKTLSRRGAPKEFLDAVRAQGAAAKDDIKALLTLSPSDFKKYIGAWNKGQAAIKSNATSQLDAQLKIYESHGRKIAMAILKGVQSQDQKLQGELERIVRRMFPGLAKQAGPQHTLRGTTPSHNANIPQHVSHTYQYNITSQSPDIATTLKHVDFSRRNKFKGNL